MSFTRDLRAALAWEPDPSAAPLESARRHPLPVGARVRHYGQQWPAALRDGTTNVVEVMGPWPDGSYEYLVAANAEWSRQPGEDNPPTGETWQWASHGTIPVSPAGSLHSGGDR